MVHSVYLARQPIFDEHGKLYAYELFYRDSGGEKPVVDDNLHATARVLVNALNYMGLRTITEGHIAFVKVDHTVLMDDIILSIAPARFVLEIMESSIISTELLVRIEKLHKKGYRFALNHYHGDTDFQRRFHGLLEIVDYVKFDMTEFPEPAPILKGLSEYRFKSIAETIESPESYDRAKAAGFDYYQGYFFSKPDLFRKERIDPQIELLLELILLLQSGASMDELIAKINASPYLLLNLLKFIRMHEGIEQDVITTAEQAVVLIGRERLANWLELMVYAHDEDDTGDFAVTIGRHATHRGCLMEELATRTNSSTAFAHAAYLTGLLSVAETIFQGGFGELLKQTRLDKHIIEALLKKNGELGQLLQLAIAIDHDDVTTINSILGQLQISQKGLNEAMMASYRRCAARGIVLD